MQSRSIKTVSAATWMFAVGIGGVIANLNSRASWAALVGIAIVPPLVMMRLWKDPPQTMSESIQDARR